MPRSTRLESARARLGETTWFRAWDRSASPESTRAAGSRAERRARLYYRLRGYLVLDANAWAGGNEVDLVLRRGRTLVFCEVKQKTGDAHGDPAEMVDEEKQRRLRRAADAWLASRRGMEDLDVRFDVVAVSARGVERIVDAF